MKTAQEGATSGGLVTDAPRALSIKDAQQGQLFEAYRQEAAVHRELMLLGAPVPSGWRQFRQFLLDLGPCPAGPGWVVALKAGAGGAYNTTTARWAQADDPEAVYWVKSEGSGRGEWNKAPVAAAKEPSSIVSDDFSQVDVLLPDPGKQKAFKLAFQLWRRQVKPAFAKAATPTFLFLYSTVLALKELRDNLNAKGLMSEHTARMKAREQDPAWNKYCEHMAHAQVTIGALPEFSSYSLITALDKLAERLVSTEQKFRA
jgi:hypothetical protein